MGRLILVIEDNEQNLYLVRFLLEADGFSIEEARDGKQGLALAEELRPCAILLDIQLPGMDGYAVAARLRENPATRDIPIIAVTSYAMAGDKEKALSAGVSGYIEKPIDPDTFVDQVRRLCRAGV